MKLQRAELGLLLLFIILWCLAWIAGTRLAEELRAGVEAKQSLANPRLAASDSQSHAQ